MEGFHIEVGLEPIAYAGVLSAEFSLEGQRTPSVTDR
jgi:hypothetical protein